MKNFLVILECLVVMVLIFIAYGVYNPTTTVKLGDAGMPNYLGSTVTNTSSTCGITTSTVVLAAGMRQYAIFSLSTTTVAYLCLAPTCVVQTGFYFNQYVPYVINNINLYTGVVSCISTTATSTVEIIYK